MIKLLIALAVMACTWRDNDPNDSSKGKTKTSDCLRCDCSTSTMDHNYYHGVCLGCGKTK